MSFRTLIPGELKTQDVHKMMLGAIAPRPIAFVSTTDKSGQVNLSPYSFFNAFGANPPLLVFSPALRGRDGATKHTLENVQEVDEAVINIVSYAMVQQMSLASSEYPKGVNEFVKAGFTMLESSLVRPPRVLESPAQIECKVKDIIRTGERGGAGNLVVCEILAMHIKEDVLDQHGQIDPYKIDQVARLGGDWYTRASKGLFTVPKPLTTLGIGVDSLPDSIRLSHVLTGNDLGLLGNTENLPSAEEIQVYSEREEVKSLLDAIRGDVENSTTALHLAARELLQKGLVSEAWLLLLCSVDQG
jgi:flavin reductase (DIM6/NTAB) family NADH-FMN oxidoreductase RutF